MKSTKDYGVNKVAENNIRKNIKSSHFANRKLHFIG